MVENKRKLSEAKSTISGVALIHIGRASPPLANAIHFYGRAYPGSNRFILLRDSKRKDYDLDDKDISMIWVDSNDSLFSEIKRECERSAKSASKPSCIALIVHNAEPEILDRLIDANLNIPILWFSWGPDLLLEFDSFRKFGPLTHKIVRQHRFGAKGLSGVLQGGIRSLTSKTLHLFPSFSIRYRRQRKFLQLAAGIMTVSQGEYEELKHFYPIVPPRIPSPQYSSIAAFENLVKDVRSKGDAILAGHSSYAINNHFDLFELVQKNLKAKQRQILAPLNYGNDWYREKVVEAGHLHFGSRFRPISTFLSFPEYVRLLAECSAYLNGARSQQGLGNILIALSLGIRVYIHHENPLFRELHAYGFEIFEEASFSSDDDVAVEWDVERESTRARKLLFDRYGEKSVLGNIRCVVENFCILR